MTCELGAAIQMQFEEELDRWLAGKTMAEIRLRWNVVHRKAKRVRKENARRLKAEVRAAIGRIRAGDYEIVPENVA